MQEQNFYNKKIYKGNLYKIISCFLLILSLYIPLSVYATNEAKKDDISTKQPTKTKFDSDAISKEWEIIEKEKAKLKIEKLNIEMEKKTLKELRKSIKEEMTKLEKIKKEIKKLSGKNEAMDVSQIKQLVKLYQSMRPKSAAAAIQLLNPRLAAAVLSAMRPRQAGKIFDAMNPKKVAELSSLMEKIKKKGGE